MPRMKYKTKDGIEFEFEGQEDEVLRLYHKVAGVTDESKKPISETMRTESNIRINMPTDQEVEAFIKSKPDYEHDLHTVQKEFFGKKFASRGASAPMYHRTNRQLTMVRKKIEDKEGRKFKAQTIDRNFKRYRMESEIQKIS